MFIILWQLILKVMYDISYRSVLINLEIVQKQMKTNHKINYIHILKKLSGIKLV